MLTYSLVFYFFVKRMAREKNPSLQQLYFLCVAKYTLQVSSINGWASIMLGNVLVVPQGILQEFSFYGFAAMMVASNVVILLQRIDLAKQYGRITADNAKADD